MYSLPAASGASVNLPVGSEIRPIQKPPSSRGYREGLFSENTRAGKYIVEPRDRGKNLGECRPPDEDQIHIKKEIKELSETVKMGPARRK